MRRLRQSSEIAELKRGVKLRGADEERKLVYLVQGQLSFEGPDGGQEAIEAGGESATRPIFAGNRRRAVVRAHKDCVVLRVPRSLCELLLDEQREAAYEVRETQVSTGSMRLFQRILVQLHAGKLELPVMPRIMQRLRSLDDDDADLDALYGIVRLEPSVTARILQAANSPVYRRDGGSIASLREALTVLGFVTGKQLALAMSLSAPFEGHGSVDRQLLGQTWRDSVHASVVAAVIARKAFPALDAERCLLAGLMHRLGHIPIIWYAAEEGAADGQELDDALAQLGGLLGREVLEAWGFDEELASVPELATEVHRPGKGAADVVDVVIVARLFCACKRSADPAARELLGECPALKRLGLDSGEPDSVLRMLEESRAEMREIQQALAG